MELNQITIAGRLGKDPYIHEGKNGKIAFLSIAESDKWKDKNGDWQEKTRWHEVVVKKDWDVVKAEKMAKGDVVLVTGKLEFKPHKEHPKIQVAYISAFIIQGVPKSEPKDEMFEGEDDLPY